MTHFVSDSFLNTLNIPDITFYNFDSLPSFTSSIHYSPLTIHSHSLECNDIIDSKDIKKEKKKRNPYSENAYLYINHRNYQVFQQSILLTLLNKFASITIKREKKKSNTTLPFFTIHSITFINNDKLDFDNFIHKRCSEMKEYDITNGINMKTATRRYKTNRITEVIHTLIDLLRIYGEEIETNMTRYKEGIKQSETMIGITIKGKQYNETEIKKEGKRINELIQKELCEGEITYEQYQLFDCIF